MTDNSRLAAEKAAQRKAGLAARAALSPQQREEKSGIMCLAASQLSCWRRAERILLYCATPTEADISLLAGIAGAEGKRTAYPRCIGEREMVALEPSSDEGWDEDCFSMRAPAFSGAKLIAPGDIDLVIAPLAAFDGFGGRIGRGAGIYDRFLSGCVNAYLLGAAFSVQRVEKAAAEEGIDIPLHAVVCEDGVWSGGKLQNICR